MINFLRWAGRVLFVIGMLALVTVGLVLTWFADQRSKKLSELDAQSRIILTSAGDQEVATSGPADGQPVLVLHGTPGGFDQGLVLGAALSEAGSWVIAPSRPGYLRTPLATGFFFADQADAMAALLDALEVPDAVVLGVGAGAVVAAELAIRHPGRVRGLVLISPPTAPVVSEGIASFENTPILGAQILSQVGGDFGALLAVTRLEKDPGRVVRQILAIDTDWDDELLPVNTVLESPVQLSLLRALAGSIYPLSPREAGARNDLVHLKFPQPLAFMQISCPVLVLSGAADTAREVVDASAIVAAAPDARAVSVDRAGSLVWFGAEGDFVNDTIEDFTKNLPPPLPAP